MKKIRYVAIIALVAIVALPIYLINVLDQMRYTSFECATYFAWRVMRSSFSMAWNGEL